MTGVQTCALPIFGFAPNGNSTPDTAGATAPAAPSSSGASTGTNAPNTSAPVGPAGSSSTPVAPTANSGGSPTARANDLFKQAQLYEMSGLPNASAMAASLRAQAQLILQSGQWQLDPNDSNMQINQISGERKPVYSAFPRLMQLPDGTVVQPKAGGGGMDVVGSVNPSGISTVEAARAAGQNAGKAVVTVAQMKDLGRDADQAIGNIDYAMGQIAKASQGGLPPGYFTPALATAAAAAKSIGIDTSKLGVDPNAVSDIQTAGKSLAVVAGSILKQIIGPNSQVTEGKIEAYINAHPDLRSDPNALQNILNWARSQYTYNREMAIDAMQNAKGGIIPPDWEPSYYTKKGAFAPIYDPLSNEMMQPIGAGPSAQPPRTQPAQTANSGNTTTGQGATANSNTQTGASQNSFKNGTTIVNPQTGERRIFLNGKWEVLK